MRPAEGPPAGTVDKETLLGWVDRDRDRIAAFLQAFIRLASPNPPGDTRGCAEHVCRALAESGLGQRLIAPNDTMPNIVSDVAGGAPGRHLVLNGHMDVFPVADEADWSFDPWGGDLVDGRIRGRGAADMKAGTTASIFTYLYLSRIRVQLRGRLSLVIVSDEETFGPWGARYLAEHHPELFGDCCLNGEPSGPGTVRFGEKGLLWLAFTVRTRGAHGAYLHASPSANTIAAELIGRLESLSDIRPPDLGAVERLVEAGAAVMDCEFGPGAARIVRRVTVNPGVIRGGAKVNLIASECRFEVDIRIPNGLTDRDILERVDTILADYPAPRYEVLVYNPPALTDPEDEMLGHIQRNARIVSAIDPVPILSLGATDARLWRYKNIPAIIYGPTPIGIGGRDEYVGVDDLIHVVKCHLASSFDYMSRSG